MSVFLAYDGSVHGDWTARYAVRFAAATAEKSLAVLYVENVGVPTPMLEAKFDNIHAISEQAGISVSCEVLPMQHGVFGGLKARIPETRDTMVVCGTRTQSGRRGFLSGTISHQLLNHRRFAVTALRIVQPGHLGIARRILLPVSGSRHGITPVLPLLRLLLPDASQVRLLRVMEVTATKFRRMDAANAGAIRHEGQIFLESLALQLRGQIDETPDGLDLGIRVSDDWVKEVIIDAGQHHTDLICIEAPKSSLAGSFRWGDPVEKVLRDAPSDVAIYRGPLDEKPHE